MASRLRFGLIGCGLMGRPLAEWIVALEDAEMVAVCDTNLESAKTFGEKLKVPYYTSHSELLQKADIDAVIISTPHDTHRQITLDCATAKRHIFLEKPMALSVKECDEMIEAAEKNNVKLMVGQVLRLLPLFYKVREIVGSGTLGEPLSAGITRIGTERLWGWWYKRKFSGGLLFMVSVHELDLLRSILGEPETIYALAAPKIRDEIDFEDLIMVTLGFKSGAIGSLHASMSAALGCYDGKIICRRGALLFSLSGQTIEYQAEGKEKVVLGAKDLEGIEDGYRHELRSFVEWVTKGIKPVLTAQDGRNAIEMAQAAYLSIERGAPVELPLK